jgi:CheY-like chemotaxis protein
MTKVLIVDDDEALRRLMRLELSVNYEVFDSGEPEQGLALALENRPDAILLDLRMPKYSGYELLRVYTSFSQTKKIPLIVVSGEAGAQTKEQCRQLGAAGYFEKPIDFVALRKFLEQVVHKHRYISRSEVRVRLQVPLKLKGANGQGEKLEAVAMTENVSISGFKCSCAAKFANDSVVEVYLTNSGEAFVGKATIAHSNPENSSLLQYGCRFIEKTGPWVLQ